MTLDPQEPWHVDKRVPLALIFAILMQTAGMSWWAASLQERVGTAEDAITRLDVEAQLTRSTVQGQAVQSGRLEEQIIGLRADISALTRILERQISE